MEARASKTIYYIVLPPGHGKSFNRGKVTGLVEADEIISGKSPLICELRQKARTTDQWGRFDLEWGKLMESRLTAGKWIVMVPHAAIGQLNNWIFLKSYYLTPKAWNENLKSRRKPMMHYWSAWSDAVLGGGFEYHSNDDLQASLLDLARLMLQQKRFITLKKT